MCLRLRPEPDDADLLLDVLHQLDRQRAHAVERFARQLALAHGLLPEQVKERGLGLGVEAGRVVLLAALLRLLHELLQRLGHLRPAALELLEGCR